MLEPQPRSVQDVLTYAETLRARRVRDLERDPWADPYAPSAAAARKVYQDALLHARRQGLPEPELPDHAAVAALRVLATRAVSREQEQREQRERASRAEARHARRQRHDHLEVATVRASLSLGARLDEALRGLLMVSEAPTQATGERPGSPSDRARPPGPTLPADRYSLLLREAERTVTRAEEELAHARRREIPAVRPLLPG